MSTEFRASRRQITVQTSTGEVCWPGIGKIHAVAMPQGVPNRQTMCGMNVYLLAESWSDVRAVDRCGSCTRVIAALSRRRY
jgi:hypothetical protein